MTSKKEPSWRAKIPFWIGEADNNITLPPNTPGAFLHLGKTGGSTLSMQLRNGCHSWVPKPCKDIPVGTQESHVSKLSTYYHNPDFRLLLNPSRTRHPYHFYVISIAGPAASGVSKRASSTCTNPVFPVWTPSSRHWFRLMRTILPKLQQKTTRTAQPPFPKPISSDATPSPRPTAANWRVSVGTTNSKSYRTCFTTCKTK